MTGIEPALHKVPWSQTRWASNTPHPERSHLLGGYSEHLATDSIINSQARSPLRAVQLLPYQGSEWLYTPNFWSRDGGTRTPDTRFWRPLL
jgi:hypothetical protein